MEIGTRPMVKQRLGDRSVVMPVSQVLFNIVTDKQEAEYVATVKEVLKWAQRKAGRGLPEEAWDLQSFDLLDIGAQPISAVKLDVPNYWCIRVSDADKHVARRSWIAEIGVLLHKSQITVGCRLQCSSINSSLEFDYSIPGVINAIVSRGYSVLDGEKLNSREKFVNDDVEVDRLINLMLDGRRARPIIAVSCSDKEGNQFDPVINVLELGRRTLGAAHVVCLSHQASLLLTEKLGKDFSVFNRAVRTYNTNMNIDTDRPIDHPIAFYESIISFGEDGSDDFLRFLVNKIVHNTVNKINLHSQLPSFSTVSVAARSNSIKQARNSGASSDEMVDLFGGE